MRHRSASMKKPNIRPPEDYEMDEIRPRTSSLPTKNTYKKPNLLTIKATAGILYEDSENDFYRQRHFETTSKGGLVNRGDSLISRSTNSIVSSGSEIGALSRTSSSVSQGSLGNDVSGKTYNVLMLGAQGVGKTALTQQFMTSEYLGGFDTSIEGIEYLLPMKFREILCSGCRGDVENVKSLRRTDDDDDDDDDGRTDDGRRAMTIAHMSFAQVSFKWFLSSKINMPTVARATETIETLPKITEII
ncbi:hypothetical protein FSP39_001313 [Pinctada imbricata]|uniref:Uncharacterized protein n=1 Tax=Pinctada imbricata TaxID=66713 RepID=A0AA89BWL8_PINIB|nr:hypothetical protein FSP39_001313 [Pinctada imbricata]